MIVITQLSLVSCCYFSEMENPFLLHLFLRIYWNNEWEVVDNSCIKQRKSTSFLRDNLQSRIPFSLNDTFAVFSVMNKKRRLSTVSVGSVYKHLTGLFPTFQYGEKGSGFKTKSGGPQDFYAIREQHLKNKSLFEDPEFPANNYSLFATGYADRHFIWRRPGVSKIVLVWFQGLLVTLMHLTYSIQLQTSTLYSSICSNLPMRKRVEIFIISLISAKFFFILL